MYRLTSIFFVILLFSAVATAAQGPVLEFALESGGETAGPGNNFLF